MRRDEFGEMRAFLEVSQERSFTRAAARMGLTPSALSHSIRALEERLGVRLLSRTTRNVAPTAAGERLAQALRLHFEGIASELEALSAFRGRPSGTVRITCTDDVIETIFRPMLREFLREYPDIGVELVVDYGFTNIVEQRIDAGVRLGESIAKDMIAVRIGPDFSFSVVGAPAYFARRSEPASPQELPDHSCINIRLPTGGGRYAWEFEKDGRELAVRVDGQLTFNGIVPILQAAIDGHGLAYLPSPLVEPYVARGELRETLTDWCPFVQGYHLYYPNRRQASPAFSLLVEALRYRV